MPASAPPRPLPGPAPPPNPRPSKQIIGLDLIRAAAALLVLCFHLGFWIWKDPSAHLAVPRAYAPWQPLFAKGWVGVEIFFVISGFVIAYSAQAVTPTRFAQHRVSRLFPAALLCSTLTAVVLLRAYPAPVVALQWLRSVTFWPAGPWIDGSYWTLPIEIAFYAFVWANLLLHKGRHFALCTAILGSLSAACCLLVLTTPAAAPGWLLPWLDAAGFPPNACFLLIHGDFFALGVFLYLLLLQGVTRPRAVALLLALPGCVAELIWHDRGSSAVTHTTPNAAIPLALWTASLLALIASVRWNAQLRAILGERGARLTRQIGIATYPLYLLHAKIGQVAIGGLHRKLGYGPALVIAALAVAFMAALISQTLEPPVRNLLQLTLWNRLDPAKPSH